jgi:hypothetical protein
VHLVAHGEGLRHQAREIDRSLALEDGLERRRRHVADPLQAGDRLGTMRPEPELMPPGPVGDDVQALVRFTGSSITSNGVPGEMTAAMGPTAPRS